MSRKLYRIAFSGYGRQKTGDRRQETEVRRQKSEDRSQKTEVSNDLDRAGSGLNNFGLVYLPPKVKIGAVLIIS